MQILREHKIIQQQEKASAGGRWKENDLIFPSSVGTPLDLRNLVKEFKDILQKTGLPEIRFHDLRHTAASIMLSRNIPVFTVSRILGHAKPSITLDVYGHLIPGAQEFAARTMDLALTPMPVQINEVGKDAELLA